MNLDTLNPAQREAVDSGGRLRRAATGRTAAPVSEPLHREPLGEHSEAEARR